ncbi:MAG: hypothetical protein II677_06190, partial [Muribaculaceae bacterium]|nr:hypothetical protein [Muribaculaceae bacterium]
LEQTSCHIFDSPASTSNPIKSFLRTQLMNKPIVPGSSIKGAIRSCLFNDFHGLKQEGEDTRDINGKVFGTMNVGDVFTRFIHVGDIVMPQTCLVNTKLFNLRREQDEWTGGWKHGVNRTTGRYEPTGFNTLYECVKPGLKGIGTIDMMAGTYEFLCNHVVGQNYHERKRRVFNNGLRTLFHIINETTWNYLQKEIEFFDAFSDGANRVQEIIDSIDRVLDMIPEDNSYCVMKMAAGAGFHSITGDWQYDDYYNEPGLWPDNDRRNAGKKKYKSRKIAEYGGRLQMMGFVLLRLIDNEGENGYYDYLDQMKQMNNQV